MNEIIVRHPSGAELRFPPGTPQEHIAAGIQQIEAAMQGGGGRQAAPPPASAGFSSTEPGRTEADFWRDFQNEQVERRPIASRLATALQGVPFVGQWADEAVGVVSPDARQAMRVSQEAMQDTRPGQTAGLQVGGAIAGAVPLAMAAGPAVVANAPATLAGRTAAGAGAGFLAGTAEGAISGAGRGNTGARAETAAFDAGLGGALGAAVGAAAPLAGEGIRRAVQHVRGTDTQAISEALGVSPTAARAVKQSLLGDDTAQAARNIGRGGPDAMLLEAGPATIAMGDAVANTGGAAGRIVQDAVRDRAQKSAQAMRGVLDTTLGQPHGRGTVAESIRKGTAQARSDAYRAAYSSPIDYASPAGREIEGILDRIPQQTKMRAIRAANERIEYEGGARQIMAQVGDDGRVVFQEMPNPQQLDFIKRAFDDIARDGTDPLTRRASSEAAFAGRIARDIRDAHVGANSAYGDALRVSQDAIRLEEAVETGYNALRAATTREQLGRQLDGASQADKLAARLGIRQFIDDQMANTRRIMSRPGTDVGEAIKAVRDLSSRSSRDKLAAVIGPRDAARLTREVDKLATAFEIQAAMAQNSKTAVRQAVQDTARRASEPGVVGKLMEGQPLHATQRLSQIFTGSTPEARAAVEAGVFEEIARALTETRGPNAQRALTSIEQAMRGQPMNERQARAVANITAAALATGGYGAGKTMGAR